MGKERVEVVVVVALIDCLGGQRVQCHHQMHTQNQARKASYRVLFVAVADQRGLQIGVKGR